MYSQTIAVLEKFDNQHDFERMCAAILIALGYKKVVPIAPRGGGDNGKDIEYQTESGSRGLGCVTLQGDKEIEAKFTRDFSKRHPGDYEEYTFFCKAHLTASQKFKFAKYCIDKLQALFTPYDIETLALLLDNDIRLKEIKEKYLNISDQVKQQYEEGQLKRISDTLDDETIPQLSQIEIAGTTIMLSGEEAVLVVYMDDKWRGQKVEVKSGQDLDEYSAEAHIIARSVKDTIICAAIFPCLPILSHLKPYYENQKSGTYEVHFREYSTSIKKRNLLELQEC